MGDKTQVAVRRDVAAGEVPRRSELLVAWFTRYAIRYVRRHFHAVRIAKAHLPCEMTDRPMAICTNHAAWWDPLLCLLLAKHVLPGRKHYAPFDAAALGKYRLLSLLGFFGIEPGTARGMKSFLRTGQAILRSPSSVLWVTAQGRFADVRERPVELQRGLGALLDRVDHGVVLPMAVEYPFWEERFPEILVRFGEPIDVETHSHLTANEWTMLLSERLETTQDELQADSMRRDTSAFDVLCAGSSGGGGIYDVWRRACSWSRGQRFQSQHGRAE